MEPFLPWNMCVLVLWILVAHCFRTGAAKFLALLAAFPPTLVFLVTFLIQVQVDAMSLWPLWDQWWPIGFFGSGLQAFIHFIWGVNLIGTPSPLRHVIASGFVAGLLGTFVLIWVIPNP